jgi:NADPH:quinone reductase-like Zn-dependent oxidoreductase
LKLATVQRPTPKAGEILVKVEAVSLNYRDTEVLEDRMGYTLTFPFTPTSDMAGTVTAVGEGVTRFAPGDRVVSMCITNWIDGAPLDYTVAPPLAETLPGVLAEYVAMPADDRPIDFTGIAVWEVRDGKLAHNWVERSAYELVQRLEQPAK